MSIKVEQMKSIQTIQQGKVMEPVEKLSCH